MNRVFREEKKYLISLPEALQACHRLAQVMHEDPHNGISGYPVRSLYFDTLDDRDFREKAAGVELRRKLRLRCYDPAADFAMLEMKQKQGASQLKRSLRVTREDAQALTRGDYAPLLRYPEPFAAECYALMHSRTTHSAHLRHLFERNACILCNHTQDLSIQIVYFFHNCLMYCLFYSKIVPDCNKNTDFPCKITFFFAHPQVF